MCRMIRSRGAYHAILLEKVFPLEIDPCSCENLISQVVVNLLGLLVTELSTPYDLGWWKGAGDETVPGAYGDIAMGRIYWMEVLCDVVDIDHIPALLGRPWQYDVGALHDYRANTYTTAWEIRRLA